MAALILALVVRHRKPGWIQAGHYAQLMELASDSVLVMDLDGRILDANLQAVAQYGYPLEALRGMQVLELRDPETQTEGVAQFARVKDGSSLCFESRHRRCDGSLFPVEVSSRRIQVGKAAAILSFIRDITARKQVEAALRASEEKFSKAFRANPDSININRLSDGTYLTVNEGFTRITGYTAEEVLGRSSLPGDLGIWAEAVDRGRLQEGLRREGRVEGLEASFRRKDGTLITGLMSAALIEVEGEPCVLSITRDITERKTQERELQRMTRLHAAQSQINQAIVWSASREELLNKICEVMVTFGGFSMAWIGRADPETHEVRVLSQCGDTQGYLRVLQVRSDDSAWGRGPTGIALREGHSCIVNDFLGASETQPWHEAVLRCGYAASATFPIHQDGWIWGALMVYSREKGFFGSQEVALLEESAVDISYALNHLAGEERRRQTEEALGRQKEEFETIFNRVPSQIWYKDTHNRILRVNDSVCRNLGMTREQLEGHASEELFPESAAAFFKDDQEVIASGLPKLGISEQIATAQGERFWLRTDKVPILGASGEVVGLLVVSEDISERKRDEAERRSLEAQLQQSQKLESLGSLAGGVAHDMNNVLAAVLGLASLLREKAAPATPEAKSLDTIVNACTRGRDVVKSLLYFAHKDLQEEQVIHLNSLVQEMTQLLSHTTLKRVQLQVDLQKEVGYVRGDPGALGHALMNLCVNAMDAMPGGGMLHIQTGLEADGGVSIRVQDTGEGMSPEVLARAMEPFFSTKGKGKGTGLGLSMVYGTMKAHDGTFELQSQAGLGTQALLHFPASRVPQAVSSATQPTDLEIPRAALSILLIDDDELIHQAMVPMLESLGHRVTPALGAAPALALLEQGLPVELVILDLNMPGMSGAEALPRILTLRPGMTVLMASGYSDEDITPLVEQHSNVFNLKKPFSLHEIQTKISALGIPSKDPVGRDS